MEYLAYATVFFIPFLVNQAQWFSYGTAKGLSLILLVSVIILFWLSGVWNEKKESAWAVGVTPLHVLLAGYFVVLGVSGLSGIDPDNSFFGSFNQSISLCIVYAAGVFACVVGFLIRKNNNFLPKLLLSSFISSLIVAFTSYTKASATLGNDSYAGAYLLFNICFGLALMFYYSKWWQRAGSTLGVLFIILSPIFFNADIFHGHTALTELLKHPLLGSGTAMGATLGVIVALVVAGSMWMFRSSTRPIKITGLVLFLTLLSGIVFGGWSLVTPGSWVNRVYVQEKTGSRFIFWDIANSGFVERPILGWGFGNYAYVYQKYFDPQIMSPEYTAEVWVTEPHNVFWEHMANTGLLGTLLFLALFAYLWITLFENTLSKEGEHNYFYIVALGALSGYLVQNFFVFDTTVPYLMFYTLLGIGLGKGKIVYTVNIQNKYTKAFISLAGGVVGIGSMIFLVYLPWQEAKAWKNLATESNLTRIPALVGKAEPISVVGNVSDPAYLYDEFFGQINNSLSEINEQNKSYVLAMLKATAEDLEKEVKINQNNFRANLVLGRLFYLYSVVNSQPDKDMEERADMYLEKARQLSINNPLSYMALAEVKYSEGDTKRAVSFARAALSLNPFYEPALELGTSLQKSVGDKNLTNYLKSISHHE